MLSIFIMIMFMVIVMIKACNMDTEVSGHSDVPRAPILPRARHHAPGLAARLFTVTMMTMTLIIVVFITEY